MNSVVSIDKLKKCVRKKDFKGGGEEEEEERKINPLKINHRFKRMKMNFAIAARNEIRFAFSLVDNFSSFFHFSICYLPVGDGVVQLLNPNRYPLRLYWCWECSA